jgi:cell wall-associated NlpC family hydrolase
VKFRPILFFLIVILSGAMLFSCGSSKKHRKKKKKKKAKTELVNKSDTSTSPLEKQKEVQNSHSPQLSSKAEKVLNSAKSYLGTPYRYGGTSREGMDCSGLVITSFRAAGVELPRTSKEQSQKGKLVEKKEVVPGDLVFFSRSFNKEVSHAGIIVESGPGKAKFIHASTSKGVRIDDLYGEYWSKLFLMARRIF